MKTKYITYMLLAVAAVLCGACENLYEGDGEDTEEKVVNVTFSSSLLRYVNGQTSDDLLDKGTAVGVFMNTNGTELAPENILASYANRKFIAEENGALAPGDPSQNMTFMPGATKVDFLAYAPYDEQIKEDYLFHLDVSDQSKVDDYDLLISNNAKGKYKTTSAVLLKFVPAVAAIQLKFEYSGGLSEEELSEAEIMLHKVNLESDFSLTQGAIDASSSGTLSINRVGDTATAFVIPTTNDTNGRKITVTAPEIDYSYEIPADIKFQSGKIYLFEVLVSPKGIEITPGGIKDWVIDEENGVIN